MAAESFNAGQAILFFLPEKTIMAGLKSFNKL